MIEVDTALIKYEITQMILRVGIDINSKADASNLGNGVKSIISHMHPASPQLVEEVKSEKDVLESETDFLDEIGQSIQQFQCIPPTISLSQIGVKMNSLMPYPFIPSSSLELPPAPAISVNERNHISNSHEHTSLPGEQEATTDFPISVLELSPFISNNDNILDETGDIVSDPLSFSLDIWWGEVGE